MVSASLLEFFFFFFLNLLLSIVFLMPVMAAEMAVFESLQIKTLTSGLVSEIIGSLCLCLSFPAGSPAFKNGVSKCCFCFAKSGVDIKVTMGRAAKGFGL